MLPLTVFPSFCFVLSLVANVLTLMRRLICKTDFSFELSSVVCSSGLLTEGKNLWADVFQIAFECCLKWGKSPNRLVRWSFKDMMAARWTLVFVWLLLPATVQNQTWRPCTGMRTSQTSGQMCFNVVLYVYCILSSACEIYHCLCVCVSVCSQELKVMCLSDLCFYVSLSFCFFSIFEMWVYKDVVSSLHSNNIAVGTLNTCKSEIEFQSGNIQMPWILQM